MYHIDANISLDIELLVHKVTPKIGRFYIFFFFGSELQ